MASNAAKARRRAVALSELEQLSKLLAKHLNVEVGDVRPTNRDPEMAQIQQVEAINGLLGNVLKASGVEMPVETEIVPEVNSEEIVPAVEEKPKKAKKAGKKAKK